MTVRRIRVLLAKPGLDGHDKGIKVLARVLRDAGMEVIYLGLHQTPQSIAMAADMEDVDVVGVSFLSGAHIPFTQTLIRTLREAGVTEPRVIVGGNIPERDKPELLAMGVVAVLPGGTDYQEIVRTVRAVVEGEAAAVSE